MIRRTRIAWASPALLLFACSSATSASDAAFSPTGGTGADAGTSSGASAAPQPEKEVESDYEAPVATGRFVWVANPKSGRVAYIDATTLQVRTVEAGNGP